MKRDDLQKHTLDLFKGDFARLREIVPEVEPTKLVRAILHDWIEKHESPEAVEQLRRLKMEVS